jgi:hypothetical protein
MGQFGEDRALRLPTARFGLLCISQFRGAAHVLAVLLRPAAPFRRAGADKVALHVHQAADYDQHQGAGQNSET